MESNTGLIYLRIESNFNQGEKNLCLTWQAVHLSWPTVRRKRAPLLVISFLAKLGVNKKTVKGRQLAVTLVYE